MPCFQQTARYEGLRKENKEEKNRLDEERKKIVSFLEINIVCLAAIISQYRFLNQEIQTNKTLF